MNQPGTAHQRIFLLALVLLSPACGGGGGGGAIVIPAAGPGSRDVTFGSTGKITATFGNNNETAYAVAVQTDDKIVVAGTASNGSNNDFAVLRLNADGSADNTFGTLGRATTNFGTDNDEAYSVAIQQDGKIVVAGNVVVGGVNVIGIARYNTDGTPDMSFDTDGRTTVTVGGLADQARAVAIQSDGKIVVAGHSFNGALDNFAVVRLSSTGALDASFGSGGKVESPVGSGASFAKSVALQLDGKILAGGMASNGTNTDFAVVRYNADGSVDAGFGAGGRVQTDFASGNDDGRSLKIQSNGRILLAGRATTGTGFDFGLVRYTTTGALDGTFGLGGKVTTDFGLGEEGFGVAVQLDAQIVVAGYGSTVSNNDVAVARYNFDGSLDTTFNGTGKVSTPVGAQNDQGYAVALQSSGKIVVAGFSQNAGTDDFLVVRYDSGGQLDNTFDIDHFVRTSVGTNEVITGVVIQTDGKIVAVGHAFTGATTDFAVARYSADGQLDPTFGSTGIVTTPFGPGSCTSSSIGLQTDGKIVCAGLYYDGADNDVALLRYNMDGSLDSSFGTGGKVTTAVGAVHDYASCMAIQPDGKIVIAGAFLNASSNYDLLVVRYSTTGSLDATFGTGGIVTTPIGTGDDLGNSLTIQVDGKIVVVGSTAVGPNTDIAVVRYNSDGSLDASFGTGGKVTTSIADSDSASHVLLQADNKLVVSGASFTVALNWDFRVVRYNTDGSLDATFGSGGSVTTSFGSEDLVGGAVLLPDGKIVVAGTAFPGANRDIALARFDSNGGLDPTFGVGGKVVAPLGNADDIGSCIALQADGKIVVGGRSNNGTDEDFALVRFE